MSRDQDLTAKIAKTSSPTQPRIPCNIRQSGTNILTHVVVETKSVIFSTPGAVDEPVVVPAGDNVKESGGCNDVATIALGCLDLKETTGSQRSHWPRHLLKYRDAYGIDYSKMDAMIGKVKKNFKLKSFLSSPFDGCMKE